MAPQATENGSGGVKESAVRRYQLSLQELEGIKAYSYKAGGYTVMDNLLSPYWNYMVTWLPRWMAPNLVTFSGLCMVGVSTAILLYHSPHFDVAVPSWCYFLYAVTIFCYQTLDAIDGKQARRTNSSTPLGQLFDHGCDALVKVFFILATGPCMKLTSSVRVMVLFCNTEVAFYLAQWEEYHTGMLLWSNGYFGVTESQFSQMWLYIMSGLFTEEVWQIKLASLLPAGYKVPLLESGFLTIENFILTLFSLITTSMFVTTAWRVWPAKAEDLPAIERGSKTIGVRIGLMQLVPMAALMIAGFLSCTGPGAEVFGKFPALQMMGLGCISTHLTTRMIIHHMAKTPLTTQDWTLPSLLCLVAATLNLYWEILGLGDASPLDHETAQLTWVGLALASYVYYVVGSVRDICNHLNVRCFHISQYRVD
ncbi:unnamed protein product [Chrysoparadoxa australica]